MTLEECYNKLHGDYNDVKSRLMNDKLIERIILKFPGDPSMQTLRDKIEVGDNPAAFRAVHTLKGVAGNLSFSELYRDAYNLTEQMRDCVSDADPILMAKLEDSYGLVIDVLKEYLDSKN